MTNEELEQLFEKLYLKHTQQMGYRDYEALMASYSVIQTVLLNALINHQLEAAQAISKIIAPKP
jgi:hypothetical protein